MLLLATGLIACSFLLSAVNSYILLFVLREQANRNDSYVAALLVKDGQTRAAREFVTPRKKETAEPSPPRPRQVGLSAR